MLVLAGPCFDRLRET